MSICFGHHYIPPCDQSLATQTPNSIASCMGYDQDNGSFHYCFLSLTMGAVLEKRVFVSGTANHHAALSHLGARYSPLFSLAQVAQTPSSTFISPKHTRFCLFSSSYSSPHCTFFFLFYLKLVKLLFSSWEKRDLMRLIYC